MLDENHECRIGDYRLVQTCSACPEQYDVYDIVSGEECGYMRLRNSRFRVTDPTLDIGYYTIRIGHPDEMNGCFEDDVQRRHYLEAGIAAIDKARRTKLVFK